MANHKQNLGKGEKQTSINDSHSSQLLHKEQITFPNGNNSYNALLHTGFGLCLPIQKSDKILSKCHLPLHSNKTTNVATGLFILFFNK